MKKLVPINLSVQEVVFQLVLHVLVFIFYVFDRRNPQIEEYQVYYFLSYTLAVFIINYSLLPRFLYQKKYLAFLGGVILVISGVILLEELVLEQIYFPDTRGARFPGVFYSLLGVLPVITILSGFKFAWDALGKQREVDALKAAVKESELQFLKSQINPHFLFNNLNNLYSYAIERSPKTPEIILELSAVLRYMLYDCQSEFVALEKEVEQLRNFTRLSKLQIEDRGEIKFEVAPLPDTFQIAPLILIVFIENAFKHSQASQADGIQIAVNLSVTNQGELTFSCQNSFQEVANNKSLSQGIGLENVRKRLELIYPDAHKLKINASNNLYTVDLRIQLS